MAAPIVYAATVAWGGLVVPGYSHVSDFISSLTQTGREGTELIGLLFGVYNLLVLALAVSAFASARRAWRWSFASLAAVALAGLAMTWFAQDPIGAPATTVGIVHIALAAVTSVCSMAAIWFGALAERRSPGGGTPSAFSLGCLAVVFVSGLRAAAAAANGWPAAGLLERITIGGFLAWLFVAALRWPIEKAKPKPGIASPAPLV